MIPTEPFNVWLFDVNAFIKETGIQPVTSLSIYQPSSSAYEPNGLFSERIFGELGTTDRMVTMSYITLNTAILQPLVYKNVVKLAGLYEEIIAGSAYATFDPVEKNFVRCNDRDKHPEADTGYTFFMGHFHEIVFERNSSRQRSDRIDILEKYKDVLFCRQLLVLPAGLRDIDEQQMTLDDINKLYQTLLSYTFSIPSGANSTMYDGVRFAIQKKAVEIYDHIEGILRYKRGFIQGVWGHRRIALGTRNVITAASYATMTPNDPQTIQPDETKLGLFQTAKALQPIVVHHMRRNFFDPIFGIGSNLIALTDPKTLELAYHKVDNDEIAKFDTPEAIEDWISRFQNVDIRNRPVTVHAADDKSYYLLMVYDEGNQISLFRSLDEFEKVLGSSVDLSKIRPLTWVELLYMSAYNAASGKHVFITRYPVIQDESCYPTAIHLCSTVPSRVVHLKNTIVDQVVLTYPEYPILGNPFLESIQLGTARLKGLDGDYDGDNEF